MEIDTSKWTRIAEVKAYAETRGISVELAITVLVNSGLSNLSPTEHELVARRLGWVS